MSIRVIGANPRRYPAEVVLQAAITRRIKDAELGLPLEIIFLDWNSRKKNYHQAKTKGNWHNVFITRLPGGGLEVEYRNPGSLEWLKDGLTGTFSAMVARTPINIELLASMHYDNLWTIRDLGVRAEIKKLADDIDEANKKVKFNYKRVAKVFDEETGQYVNKEEPVAGTMYSFHKERREAQFSGKYQAEMTAPMGVFNEQQQLNKEKVDIEQSKRQLQEREERVSQKEKDLGVVVDVIPTQNISEIPTPEHTDEELIAIGKNNFGKFRKLAKEKYGIVDAFKMKFPQIMEAIKKTQRMNIDDGESSLIDGSAVAPEEGAMAGQGEVIVN
jgi:hypothetical protein